MTEPREQFTFYRSFYDSIQRLSKRDQSSIILAVCAYAIYEQEPQNLSPAAATAFDLMRPILNSARKKAANGKQGGSKIKAPPKQVARKKEIEKEIEKEKEIESNSSKVEADVFNRLWDQYPPWRRGDRQEAWEAYKTHVLTPEEALAMPRMLDKWKASEQWNKDGGQYIPNLANWLERGIWRADPPKKDGPIWGASGELGEAELQAIHRLLAEQIEDVVIEEELP